MKPFHSARSRRDFVRRASALGAASWIGLPAWVQGAEAYPTKPIHLVVGYPPGQTVDSAARAAAAALATNLGQPVVVDNHAGANGIIGAQEVKQAAPDGYTLLLGTSGQLAINPGIYRKLPYDC
jgi:tripartite-type tricarboxylate transporter receptor subunit TctC